MLATDIAAFGSRRDDDVQQHLRETHYRIIDNASRNVGLPEEICHREDRGDGILMIAPPCVSAELLLDPFVSHVRAGVRRHNRLASAPARIQLKMAVHAGQVHFDAHGVSGQALIHLFRLLEAREVKKAVDTTGATFALTASQRLYEDVVRHQPGLIDASVYQPITIALKETRAPAWIWLADPALEQVTSTPRTEPLVDLNSSDLDIAWLVASGWSRESLADELGLSIREAETRICRTLAKLCLTDSRAIIAAVNERHQQSQVREPANDKPGRHRSTSIASGSESQLPTGSNPSGG